MNLRAPPTKRLLCHVPSEQKNYEMRYQLTVGTILEDMATISRTELVPYKDTSASQTPLTFTTNDHIINT